MAERTPLVWVSGSAQILQVTDVLTAPSHNTVDLGSSGTRWRNAYVMTIGIGSASHDPTGLTAPRTYTYPDMSGVFAMASQLATSGTYTPTLANVANVASSTANGFRWLRAGNVVFLGGVVSLTPTAAATLTQLSMTVPIASTMANTVDDANGTATTQQAISNGAFIRSDGAGKLLLQMTSAGTTLVAFRVMASYTVN